MHVRSEWNRIGVDGRVLIPLLPLSAPKFPNDVPVLAFAPQHILVRDQALQSDRSARVYAPGADSHFGAEPIPEPVREARARVDEHARRVDAARERAGGGDVLGDDAVSVMRGMRVDVLHGGREGRQSENREREAEVLGCVRVWRGGVDVGQSVGGRWGEFVEGCEGGRIAEEGDRGVQKCFCDV